MQIIPKRKIEGISAILLPFYENGTPDFDSLLAHVDRTYDAGLTPAVNMDAANTVNGITEKSFRTTFFIRTTNQSVRMIPGATLHIGSEKPVLTLVAGSEVRAECLVRLDDLFR